ncbi:TPA: threonine synthase [Patescibacteria group bacterium]|nr:threonine synthase [Candidatus Gracilibacteria bacterium]
MKKLTYMDTRGSEYGISMNEVILRSTSKAGGLFIPEYIPSFSRASRCHPANHKDYQSFLTTFLLEMGLDFHSSRLEKVIREAYKPFWKQQFLSLKEIGPNYLLNLHYGPTESFKDYALAPMGGIINALLEDMDQKAIVLAATSGDTGSAALAGLGSDLVSVIVLYPHNRVSDIQERQMTYFAKQKESHAFSVKNSDFDYCQTTVKKVFNDLDFATLLSQKGYLLLSANSINWLRICIQTAYMAWITYIAKNAPTVVIPSGNSGHWLAAWYAKKMFGNELIGGIKIATNDNNILERVFTTGEHYPNGSTSTTSPSMDIDISSNFERPICHILGVEKTANLYKNKSWKLTTEELQLLNSEIPADHVWSASQEKVAMTQYNIATEYGITVDPHTATGLSILYGEGKVIGNHIFVSTANASKFLESTVEAVLKQKDIHAFSYVRALNIETSDLTSRLFNLSADDVDKDRRVIKFDSHEELERIITILV